MFNRIIHYSLFILFFNSKVFAQEGITAEFSDFNKAVFFQGEAIVLCAEVFNNTADNIAVCYNSRLQLFSTTYNKNALELVDIAPINPKYPNVDRKPLISSHPEPEGKGYVEPAKPCDFNGYGNSLVEKKSKYYLTYLINECIGNVYCEPGIGFLFPLPCGEYIFTVTFYFSSGEKIKKDFKFRIDPIPADKAVLSDQLLQAYIHFGRNGRGNPENGYNPSDPNSLHYFFEHCEDAAFRDKAFYYIAPGGLLRESELEKIPKVTNKALLIHVLYRATRSLSLVGDNTEKRNRDVIPVYDKILKALEDKDPAISEALIKKIKSENFLADKDKDLRKIPDQRINGLTNYALRKKK